MWRAGSGADARRENRAIGYQMGRVVRLAEFGRIAAAYHAFPAGPKSAHIGCLVWFSPAGAILRVPLWFAAAPADPATAGYLLVQFALFVALRHGVPRVAFLAGTADTALVRAAVRAAFWIAGRPPLTAHEDHFALTSVAAATAAIIAILGVAYRDQALDDTIAAAGALALATLASWNLPLPAPRFEFRRVPPGAEPCRELRRHQPFCMPRCSAASGLPR